MYCKIGLMDKGVDTYAILLPDELRHNGQCQQWAACLSQNDSLYVSNVRLTLTIGDWLCRKLRSYQGGRRTIAQLEQAVYTALDSIGIAMSIDWVKLKPLSEQHRNSHTRYMNLCSQVLQWVQGRKLLYDEWLGLVKDQLQVRDGIDANCATSSGQHQPIGEAELLQAWRWLLLYGHMQLRSAVEWQDPRKGRTELRCLRCYENNLIRAVGKCRYCGEHCYYCSSCLQLGRSRTCAPLLIGRYYSPIIKHTSYASLTPEHLLEIERFSLSDAQLMATNHALSFVYNRLSRYAEQTTLGYYRRKHLIYHERHQEPDPLSSQFLLWAVTGAGKTEMIFPLVAYMVALGGRVLLATPRRDVVLELSPRLHKAFPELSIVTLYGGSGERWQYGQLVLATTHQLMRYQHGFDLVIIDELDAFPYHGDKRLYRVAAEARTPHGVTILLSATPPSYLQKEIHRGRLAHIKLPVRYHRHPLPVPIRLKVPLVVDQLRSYTIPRPLIRALQQSLAEEAQVFIFLQRIAHTEAYAKLLRLSFPDINIEATSSQDAARTEKVMLFRQREIRVLVTTTILERGVTVPRSHVYICDAEAELFDEASLVQMAGRAGRSSDAPNGKVYFLSQQWSTAQKRAIKQIKSMNRLAMQQGYLLPQYLGERGIEDV